MSVNGYVKASLMGMALLTTAACSSSSSESEPSTKPAEAPAAAKAASPEEAKQFFGQRCAVCHGDAGQGDGVGAASLDPKPRNFTDAAWHASIDDATIEKTILGGGAAVGKSAIMPSSPDLKNNEPLLKALVQYIRSFKR